MKNIIFKAVLLFLAISSAAFGQSISIFDIDTTNFPTMKAKFYAFDKDGNQVRPSASELSITEDGVPRTITNVSCPTNQPLSKVSLALSIDISGSMGKSDFGELPINLGKLTATTLCNAIVLPASEFAFQTCNDKALIIQDFTKDKNKFLNAVQKISDGGGNDFVEQLLNNITGILNIVKNGKNKRVAVLYTDAWWGALPSKELQNCIDTCKKYNIEFYTVIYSRIEAEPNGIKSSLNEICKQTGGLMFDGVTSQNAAKEIALRIQKESENELPCLIEWQSIFTCLKDIINLELKYPKIEYSKSIYYTNPDNLKANLEFQPNNYRFINPQKGNTLSKEIIVTAQNLKFSVSSIKSSNELFDINPKNFTLEPGESKSLFVSYKAQNNKYEYCDFILKNNVCEQILKVSAGRLGFQPSNIKINVISPNGGEVFVAGGSNFITWNGVSSIDTCQIDFSLDNGLSWQFITNKAVGYSYKWENIPKKLSDKCLVNIIQLGDSISKNVFNYNRLYLEHFNQVTGVSFSPNNIQLASCSLDGTICIWNSEIGNLIRVFKAHNKGVTNVTFSPDGSILASCGFDKNVVLWDVKTWKQIMILKGHNDFVTNLAFNYQGNVLASGSNDNTIKLWDVKTGNELNTLIGHTSQIKTVNFNTNNILASGSEDNTIKLWDVKTGNELNTLIGHTSSVNSLVFSKLDNTLISGGQDNKIKIWDIISGIELYTYPLNNSPVKSIALNQDESLLLIGSADSVISLLDYSNFNIINKVKGYATNDKCLVFSNDGTKFASRMYDSAVKHWVVNNLTSINDQSDAVFSIVAPSPSSKDIDMKECLVGVSKDSLVSEFVINKGSYPYRVDSVYFTGADASAFSQVSGFPKFMVDTNSSKTVELRFNPSRVGLHQAKVNIITQTDTLIQNITGTGILPTIEVVNNLIDFGYIDVGLAKDTLQAITIKNISNVDIDIKNTYHSGPNDKDFTTIKGGGAFKLPAGETAKLDMRFLPTSVGRTSGTLMFEYDGIGSPAVVQLFGAGIGGVASLKLDSIEIETSKIVEYPVKLTLDSKVLKSGANAVNFDISYNNTLLYPSENYPITNKDGFATLSFKNVPLSTEPIQILETLRFKTGLGNAIETPLTISNFELLGTTEEIDVTLNDGNLKLTDVCYDGGVRLLNPNSVVSMANISPNPVNSIISIDLNLIEIGNTEVSIYNLLGEKVKTIFSKEISETGSISINSDLSDLSNGQYVVIFTTPTYTERQNVLILK